MCGFYDFGRIVWDHVGSCGPLTVTSGQFLRLETAELSHSNNPVMNNPHSNSNQLQRTFKGEEHQRGLKFNHKKGNSLQNKGEDDLLGQCVQL